MSIKVGFDFPLIKAKAKDVVLTFTNADGSVYDMTGSTAICKFYKVPPAVIDITCSINVVNGTVTIPFTAVHSDTLGTYEYTIEETTVAPEVVELVNGNVVVEEYVFFSETIDAWLSSELPANLVLTFDYQNQRIFYWRNILQAAFEIDDADLNVESAWPEMVNSLIAKLVVYDALELSLKGGFVQFMGGNYTSSSTITSGSVKSIETGPTKVEYNSVATAAKDAVTVNAGGTSMLDAIKEAICGLANFLEVKVPMCKQMRNTVTPAYVQNPNWEGTALPDL